MLELADNSSNIPSLADYYAAATALLVVTIFAKFVTHTSSRKGPRTRHAETKRARERMALDTVDRAEDAASKAKEAAARSKSPTDQDRTTEDIASADQRAKVARAKADQAATAAKLASMRAETWTIAPLSPGNRVAYCLHYACIALAFIGLVLCFLALGWDFSDLRLPVAFMLGSAALILAIEVGMSGRG